VADGGENGGEVRGEPVMWAAWKNDAPVATIVSVDVSQ
jgi:hypothetical protein